MSKGKALAVLTMDAEQEIRNEIAGLESREECHEWAYIERKEEDRTWVYEALREQAIAVDGEL